MTRPDNPCTWSNGGVCRCWEAEQEKPDPFGRVWMHSEEGLSFTKASMSRFVMFCVGNNVEIGDIMAGGGQPPPPRAWVVVAVRIHPDLIPAFERETGGKLRKPPRIVLNSGDNT